MPAAIETAARVLDAIPFPGHSVSHTAFFDARTGIAFVGDLFLTGGVTAIMRHENPLESIRSLRLVARLEPARMLNGHGLDMERPAKELRGKADRLEAAVERILELHARGWGELRITRSLFPHGWGRDLWFTALTGGEFDRLKLVRAVVKYGG